MKNICFAGAALAALSGFGQVDWYAVDPLSEVRYMPDKAPANGEKGGVVRMIAAKDEYEPGSFVLVADQDLGKVQLEVGDLRREEGRGMRDEGRGSREVIFPKENIDIRNVKVWYQNGNGWISYFLDKKLYLCPELLLHDEDLVKVDTEKGWNYARLTEKDGTVRYHWLNPPGAVDTRREDTPRNWTERYVGSPFCCMKENFSDSPSFCGVTLKKGVHKQIWLTVKVGKDVCAGLYRGEVKVKGEGEQRNIPISLRVLDFELPKPGTYLDCTKPFGTRFNQYISLKHVMALNGGNRELAIRQIKAILKNFVEHGDVNPRYWDREEHPEWGMEAGQDFGNAFYKPGDMLLVEKAEARYQARLLRRELTERCGGWYRPFMTWNNEIGLAMQRAIRDTGIVRIYQDEGFRYAAESKYAYPSEAQLPDLYWPPTEPAKGSFDFVFKTSRLGAESGWYACQHVGVENPAFNRRQYGMGAYRAGFTCDANYAQHLAGWNDIAGELYKQMMFVYGTGNGCVDTIAWEGVREGLDDIRYATKLQQLANPLLNSTNVEGRYAAKLAMKTLADADGDDKDLTTLRLEIIRHIERLRGLAVKGLSGSAVKKVVGETVAMVGGAK